MMQHIKITHGHTWPEGLEPVLWTGMSSGLVAATVGEYVRQEVLPFPGEYECEIAISPWGPGYCGAYRVRVKGHPWGQWQAS